MGKCRDMIADLGLCSCVRCRLSGAGGWASWALEAGAWWGGAAPAGGGPVGEFGSVLFGFGGVRLALSVSTCDMGFEHIAGTVVATWALNTETATTSRCCEPTSISWTDSTVRHHLRPPRYPRRRSQLNARMVACNPSHVPNTTLLQAHAQPLLPVPSARPPPSNMPNTTLPHPHPSARRARQPVAQHDAPAQHDAQSAATASTYFLVPIESSRR